MYFDSNSPVGKALKF